MDGYKILKKHSFQRSEIAAIFILCFESFFIYIVSSFEKNDKKKNPPAILPVTARVKEHNIIPYSISAILSVSQIYLLERIQYMARITWMRTKLMDNGSILSTFKQQDDLNMSIYQNAYYTLHRMPTL